MKSTLRAWSRRGRWRYLRSRCRWKRRYRRIRQVFASPLGATSLALSPLLLAMAASAAVLRAAPTEEAAGREAAGVPTATMAEKALAVYETARTTIVRRYAERFGIEEELASLIYETAREEQINPEIAFRLVHVESSFRPTAVGPAGSVGLAQVKPSTARWLDSTVTREHLFEARTNLRLGFRYLRLLMNRYGSDVRLALLAYNRGPGTVAALLALGEDPANGYATKILGNSDRTLPAVLSPEGSVGARPSPAGSAKE